jgi:hypothetical protein
VIRFRAMTFKALTLLALAMVAATGTARADLFNITATIGGLTGTGSFQTNGVCALCISGTTLTNFSFTIDDDTFIGGLDDFIQFNRPLNSLGGSVIFGADLSVDFLFFGETFVQLADPSVLPSGTYTITPAAVTSTPEPSAFILFGTVLGVLTWRIRKRSVVPRM